MFKAGDIALRSQVVVAESESRGARAALAMLQDKDREFGYVVDPRKRFLGMVSVDSLRAALKGHEGSLGLHHAFLPDVRTVAAIHPVNELFGEVAHSPWPLPVIDADGRYVGAISKTTLLRFMDRNTD